MKPAKGADGARVPLVRAGFRPRGPYRVSFIYLQPGSAFGRKGESNLSLARLDVPVSVLEWELFLPEKYEVRKFAGDVWPRELVTTSSRALGRKEAVVGGVEGDVSGEVAGGFVGGLSAAPPLAAAPTDKASQVSAETGLSETITVTATTPPVGAQDPQVPSANVLNLQRRVAGVLPVRMDVPRTGRSHWFVRPLVVNEDTTVTFRYRARS